LKWRVYPEPLHPKDALYNFYFIRLFTKVIQDEYKDQSEATILATFAKITRLMKGVTKNTANCPDLEPTHIIVMPEASPSRPTTSREHQPVHQTLSARHRTLSEVAASIFLEHIFRTGIHASKLPDLPSTPPRRHVPVLIHLQAPATESPLRPRRRDPLPSTRKRNTAPLQKSSTSPCRCIPPRLMPQGENDAGAPPSSNPWI
jgi:hypothetical protein